MAKKRKSRKRTSGKPCITKGGNRVARKKTGRKGCPKGSRPATKKRKKR